MGAGTVASIFSEPTSRTIAFTTFIALFELVNITGQMDSVVSLINNANILPEFTILEGKEKLILIPTSLKTASLMYSDLPISLWADLKFHNQDYIIGAYLFYVLLRIWIHRPSKISKKRKTKMSNHLSNQSKFSLDCQNLKVLKKRMKALSTNQ